jgi:hypothetical protein
MYTQESLVAIQTLESDRQQYVRLAACDIAQQYFSATFVALLFHSGKEKFDAHFKNVIISM